MQHTSAFTGTRRAVLAMTIVAWALPFAVALWLDVERFIHPYCDGSGGYEKEPKFQIFFFLLRFGWWLALGIVVLLAVQVVLLRNLDSTQEPTATRRENQQSS